MRIAFLSIALLATASCATSTDGVRTTGCPPANDFAADTNGPGRGNTIAIAAIDDRFDPGCVELGSPGNVRLVVRNDGRHPHNLSVGDAHRVSLDAGQVGILDVDVPTGGLRYVCTIHPGMEGELRVSG